MAAKEKKTSLEIANAALSAAIGAINKKYPGVIVPAGSGYPPLTRATWGNLLLDAASNGGFARGKIHRAIGLESSGKSQLLMHAFAVNQDRCHICWRNHKGETVPWCPGYVPFRLAWIDAEGVWQDEWALRNGIRIPEGGTGGLDPNDTNNNIWVVWPDHAEQTLEIINILLESRAYSMVVLDSLAVLQPIDEAEKSMDQEPRMASQAKLNNRGNRHWLAALRHSSGANLGPSSFMFINHLYADLSNPKASDTTTGGRGQNYGSSFDIYLQRREYMTRDGKTKYVTEYGEAKGDDIVKQMSRFHIRKSRICKPGKIGEYWAWVDSDEERNKRPGDIEYGASLFEYAMRYGVIYKEKKDYLTTNGENLGTKMDEVKAALLGNSSLHDSIVELLTKKMCPEQYGPPAEQIGEAKQDSTYAEPQQTNTVVDLD